MNAKAKKSLQEIIYVLILLLAIIILFFWYTTQNRTRMEERNKNYAADSAQMTANRIDEELINAKTRIGTYSYFIGNSLKEPQITAETLKEMEENTIFDAVMFTNTDGIDRASDGRTTNVKNEEFFIDGMKGNSDIDITSDSYFYDEPMISFYSPIHYKGEIIGVLRGAYMAKKHLQYMLKTTYFNEKADVYLCTLDEKVIACSCGKEHNGNIIDNLLESGVIDSETADKAEDIFQNGGAGAFLCDSSSKTDNICVINLPENDYVLVQTFPKKVTQQMIRDENLVGVRLEAVLIGLFIIYIISLLIRATKATKQTLHAERSVADRKERQYRAAITSSAFCTFEFNLTKDVVENDIVRIIDDTPVSLLEKVGLKAPCKVSECFDKWKAFVLEESMEEYSRIVNTEYLKEQFANGETEVNIDYWGWASEEEQMCVRQSFIMTKDYETDDIMVMVVSKDITDIVKKQKEQTQALQDALMQAQHASRAKTTFLSNMSHDIRTPNECNYRFYNHCSKSH